MGSSLAAEMEYSDDEFDETHEMSRESRKKISEIQAMRYRLDSMDTTGEKYATNQQTYANSPPKVEAETPVTQAASRFTSVSSTVSKKGLKHRRNLDFKTLEIDSRSSIPEESAKKQPRNVDDEEMIGEEEYEREKASEQVYQDEYDERQSKPIASQRKKTEEVDNRDMQYSQRNKSSEEENLSPYEEGQDSDYGDKQQEKGNSDGYDEKVVEPEQGKPAGHVSTPQRRSQVTVETSVSNDSVTPSLEKIYNAVHKQGWLWKRTPENNNKFRKREFRLTLSPSPDGPQCYLTYKRTNKVELRKFIISHDPDYLTMFSEMDGTLVINYKGEYSTMELKGDTNEETKEWYDACLKAANIAKFESQRMERRIRKYQENQFKAKLPAEKKKLYQKEVALPPKIFRKLNDHQRTSLMKMLSSGKLSADRALEHIMEQQGARSTFESSSNRPGISVGTA
eukprot:CAMPEP_0167754942 /NCGR_PEP_ID=MMETSP0110_2-20121227/8551_1 /TAXON_ID=629695 /ORGANISM="Gymnochlora sp., Strain CCMP2014" /LENGTH=452 /DNA_ID=CAMNT_0007640879 /DNA_START=27 /DNA_END=1385 /DNA_ORIENTATION=-